MAIEIGNRTQNENEIKNGTDAKTDHTGKIKIKHAKIQMEAEIRWQSRP